MPVPSHDHATALMTEYTYHGQENRLDTYGLEPPGPYEILLKASLQVRNNAEIGLPRSLTLCRRLHAGKGCNVCQQSSYRPMGGLFLENVHRTQRLFVEGK